MHLVVVKDVERGGDICIVSTVIETDPATIPAAKLHKTIKNFGNNATKWPKHLEKNYSPCAEKNNPPFRLQCAYSSEVSTLIVVLDWAQITECRAAYILSQKQSSFLEPLLTVGTY